MIKVRLNEDGSFPDVVSCAPALRTWATWVPHRNPPFKIHNGLNPARVAMTCHYTGGKIALYELSNWDATPSWIRREYYDPPVCKDCGVKYRLIRFNYLICCKDKYYPYQSSHLCKECKQKAKTTQ